MEKETIYSDMNDNTITQINCADDKEFRCQLETCIAAWLDGNIQEDGKPFPNIVNAGVFLNIDALISSISAYKKASGFMFEMTSASAKEIFEAIAGKYKEHERFKLLDAENNGQLIGIYTYQEKDQK